MVLILPRSWYFYLIVLAGGILAITEGWSRLHPIPIEMACADFGKQAFTKAPAWIRLHGCVLDYSSYLEPYNTVVGVRVFGSKTDALNPDQHALFIFSTGHSDEISKIKDAAKQNVESDKQSVDISAAGPTQIKSRDAILRETDLDLEPAEFAEQFREAASRDVAGRWARYALQQTSKPQPAAPSPIVGVLMMLIGIGAIFSLFGIIKFVRQLNGKNFRSD